MSVPSLHWGERTDLLEKHLGYVFSLDLNYTFDLADPDAITGGLRVPIEAVPSESSLTTFHVLDENLVNTVDGVVRDVPKAKVVRGTDGMVFGDTGVVNLDGRLLLESDAGAAILMAYNGVIRIPGLRARLRQALRSDGGGGDRVAAATQSIPAMEGSAYVATRYESSQTKFRWLVQNQLVGFGHAAIRRAPQQAIDHLPPRGWALALSFDLYSAG